MRKFKPLPLKDKRVEININTKTRYDTWHAFFEGDVKLAIEWLRNVLGDDHIDYTAREVRKLINEAFPDLCPSGDLIADKSNRQNP